jgi:protein-disulfide isomerase
MQKRIQFTSTPRLLKFLLAAAALLVASAAVAQRPPTNVLDASVLRPPAGARVAIVEFADMQCPACAHANPLVIQAAKTYKMPLIHHDVVIPLHNWSRIACINTRWFEAQRKGLGDEYRSQVFANQSAIFSPAMLQQFTVKFAKSHGITLPFELDPGGKFAAMVEADNQLSKRVGITQTPSVFVVTSGSRGAPYIEVLDMNNLYQTIDQALADTKGPAPKAAPIRKPVRK